MIYRALVFVHVLLVLGLSSTLVVEWAALSGMRAARESAAFRAFGRQLMWIERFHPVWGIGIFGTGIYLTTAAWTFTTPFVLSGLVATFGAAAVGGAFNGPRFRKIEALGATMSTEVPASAREEAGQAGLRTVHGAQCGLTLALFFVMTAKPDWGICIGSLVAFTVLGAVVGAKVGGPSHGKGKDST